MLKNTVAAAALGVVFASSAQAALLTDIQGTVLVNRGSGFRIVTTDTELNSGDRVLVRGKGGAKVTFGAGCVASVKPRRTFVVPPEQACQSGSLNDTNVSDATETGGDGFVGALIGGGGLAGGLVLGGGGGGGRPASP